MEIEMAKRIFVDAPANARCQANIKLRDGSFAQCGRYKINNQFCKQHTKIAERNAHQPATQPE